MKQLKISFLSILGISMLMGCGGSKAEKGDYEFKLGTGINLSHWLSQSPDFKTKRATQISKKDIDSIAAMGFDHIRIPIDEVQFYDESDALKRDDEAFRLLKQAIDWALEDGMNVVVDLHIIRSHHFNNENSIANNLFENVDAQKRHIRIWKDLQSSLKDYPNDRVAYELLNEAVAPTPENLNDLEAKLIASIREVEPYRSIVVGSNMQQSVYTVKYLKVPANDKHLIISFHYYNPILLTHYGAPWTRAKDLATYKPQLTYPGLLLQDTAFYKNLDENIVEYLRSRNEEWNVERIENDMMDAVRLCDSLGLQAYCGEYGAYPVFVDHEVMLKWYRDISSVFRKHHIANAHWCYKGDFPVVDENGNPNEIAKIILNK